jgi:hypothetical protein
MRAPFSLAALALLAGCAQFGPPRHTKVYRPSPVTDEAGAIRAVQLWRETLGLKPLPTSLKATLRVTGSSPSNDFFGEWTVEGTDTKGARWTMTVSRVTGRVVTAYEHRMVMGAASSSRRYTRGEDAMKDIVKTLEPLMAGREVTLTSFDMGAEMMPGAVLFSGFGRSMFGGMSAHYSVLANGKPFFAGGYGIDVELDPATGEVTSYTEKLDTPPTGSPLPLVLPFAAVAAAEKSVGVKAGTFGTTEAILGWAVPAGTREAHLYYYVDGSNGGVKYPPTFISAETGLVDKALPKAMAAGGVVRGAGGLVYRLTGTGGGFSIYSSSGVIPPGTTMTPPKKPVTKKKP